MTHGSTYLANQAYRSAAVAVPPLRGVIMLLDGAITFLQKSSQARRDKRFEEGFQHLTRATAILRGLSHHLNPNVPGGAGLAKQLFETYDSLIMACLRSPAAENYRRVIASLTKLRDAWQFVEMTAGQAARAGSGESPARR